MKFDRISILSLIILAIGLVLEFVGFRCSCIYLSILYLFFVIISIKKYTLTHSFSLFLLCFGVFLMGRVVLDALGVLEINLATKWHIYYFSDRTIRIVNTSMALSLIFIYIGLESKGKTTKRKISQERLNKIYVLTKRMVIILLPFAIAKLYFDFSQIRAGTYTDLYLGLERSPLVVRAGWYLATLLLPILLANTIGKKQIKIFFFLFVLVNFFDFLQGSRGALLRPGMFFLWYYYKVISEKKASNVAIISVFIVFAFVANVILEMRSDEEREQTDALGKVMYVAEGLGSSYYFNSYYVECHKEIKGNEQLYVVGPVIDFFVGLFDRDLRGQSETRVERCYGLSHKITHYIAPQMYADGHGFGCSYIAEIFSTAGFISLILFSLLIGKFIRFVEDNVKTSPTVRIVSWFWIQNLMFMPRGDLFGFVINMSFSLILFRLIFLVTQDFKRKPIVYPL